jgi:hypothetical protein
MEVQEHATIIPAVHPSVTFSMTKAEYSRADW